MKALVYNSLKFLGLTTFLALCSCSPFGNISLVEIKNPNLSWNTDSYDYGSLNVGSAVNASFNLVNSGQASAVNCGPIQLSDSVNFSIVADNCSGSTMAPGQQCQVEIASHPTTTGVKSLVISRLCDDALVVQNAQAQISVTGVEPHLSWSPLTNDFGSIYVATSSSPQAFTLSNTGSAEATSCSSALLTNSTDFSIVADTCATADLALASSCIVSVQANPMSMGNKSTTLVRACTFGGVVTTTSNQITVTGRQAVLAWSPLTNSFGSVQIGSNSSAQIFTLSNSGNAAALSCSAPVVSDTVNFSIISDTCSTGNLANSTSCAIQVQGNPTSVGLKSATISRTCTVGGVASTTANQITVNGSGLPSLAWSPLTHDFGYVNTGLNSAIQSFTLTNSGPVAATSCSAPTIDNTTNFTILTDGCGSANLAAGGSCNLDVRANPNSTGLKSATISRTCAFGGTATTTSNQITVTGTIQPSVPASIAAQGAASRIDLSWSASTGTGPITYNILRSTTSGSGYTTLSSGISGTSYSDTTTVNGATYYYVVQATSVGGTSANSNEASGQSIANFNISAVTVNGGSALEVSWGSAAGASSYTLKYGASSGSYTTTVSSNATSPTTVTGLTPGATYYFMVTANNAVGSGNSVNANSEMSGVPLGAFTISSVTQPGSAQALVNFGSSAGANSYTLRYGTVTGMYLTTFSTSASSPQTVTGLTNGTPYYFMVYAVNSSGQLAATSEGSLTPVAPASIAGSLTATATTSNIDLNWNASSGGGNITYNIYRSTTSGTGYSLIASTVAMTTYSDATAANGITYYYVVQAVNEGGTSANSNEATGRAISDFNLTAVTVNGGSALEVSWGSATGAAAYTLKYGTSPGSYTTTVSSNAFNPTTVSGLTPGTTYYFMVTATNTVGSGNSIDANSEISGIPLGAFNISSVTQPASAQASVNFGNSTGSTSYILRYGTSSGIYGTTFSTSASSPQTVTGLTNGTPYYFMVYAVNSSGQLAATTEGTLTPVLPTSIPAALVANATTSNIDLNWNASSGGGSITYNILRSTTSGSGYITLASGISGTSYSDATALNGTIYYYVVQAVNAAGTSGNSNEASGQSISNFNISAVTVNGGSALEVSWGSAAGASSYTLKYGTSSGSYTTTVSSNATSPTTVTGLTPGATYYFMVTANNAVGSGNSVNANSEMSGVPLGAFTISSVTVSGSSALQVSWGSALGASSYTLKYGTSSGSYTTTVSSNATSPTMVTGLTPGTTYYFMVTAIRSGNNINANSEMSGIPLGSFNLTSATRGLNSSSVTWTSSAGATSYTLKYGTTTGSYGTIFSTAATSPQNVTGLSSGVTYYYRVSAINSSGSLDSTSEISQTTYSSFSNNWPFDFNTTADYDYDNTKIEFTGGVSRLIASDQTDDDNTSTGFAGGTYIGLSSYGTLTGEPASNGLKLGSDGSCNGSTTNCINELDSSWTPKYSNIILYTKMNGTGSIANNGVITSTIGANGIASNANGTGMAYGTAKVKTGITIDVTDDSISIPEPNLPKQTNPRSMSFWFYTTSTPGTYFNLGGYGGNTTGELFYLLLDSSRRLLFRGFGTAAMNVQGNAKYILSAWNHAVVTYDGTTVKLYLNGELDVSGTPAINTYSLASNFIIGMGADHPKFRGNVDEIAVWNAVLTDREIKNIYERQSAVYAGSFTSRVMDAYQTGQSWTSLNWQPTLPFYKNLPDYASGAAQNESNSSYSSLASSSLMTGIVGLWHLDESSWNGTTGEVIDSSGNGNHGTAKNGALITNSAILNRAGLLDGTNDYIDAGDINAIDGTTAMTVSFWVKPAATATLKALVSKWSAGSTLGWVIESGVSNGSQVVFGIQNNGVDAYGETGINALVIGKWTHVVMVFNGAGVGNAGKLQGYIDGSVSGLTYSGTIPSVVDSNSYALQFGQVSNNTRIFNGSIDEVAIWNRSLSSTEVAQLYARGASRLKFQVRSCVTSNCSNAADTWKGPDGTDSTYFSELFNMTTQAAVPSGTVTKNLPNMLLQNYTSPVISNRYFQYRAIFESDTSTVSLMPELKTVSVGPVAYDATSPYIIGKNGVSYNSLSTYSQTLGMNGCSSGVVYNLGVGASSAAATWYYWNGSSWVAANGTPAQANSASDINANATTFGAQIGTGTVYFKAYLKSSGTSACELDNIQLNGLQ